MTSPSIPKPVREFVKRRANFCCEYCQMAEWLSGIEGEIDHIIPRAEGGSPEPPIACVGSDSVDSCRLSSSFNPQRKRLAACASAS